MPNVAFNREFKLETVSMAQKKANQMRLVKSAMVVAIGLVASIGSCAAKQPGWQTVCDEFSVDIRNGTSISPMTLSIPRQLYPYSSLTQFAVSDYEIDIKTSQPSVCQYQGVALRQVNFLFSVLNKDKRAKLTEPVTTLMAMDIDRFGIQAGPWDWIGTINRYGNAERLKWQKQLIDLAASQKLEVNAYGFRFVDQKVIDDAPMHSPLKQLSGLYLAPPNATEPGSSTPLIFVCREKWQTSYGESNLCSVMYDIEPGVGFFYEFFSLGPAPSHWLTVDRTVRSIAKSLFAH